MRSCPCAILPSSLHLLTAQMLLSILLGTTGCSSVMINGSVIQVINDEQEEVMIPTSGGIQYYNQYYQQN